MVITRRMLTRNYLQDLLKRLHSCRERGIWSWLRQNQRRDWLYWSMLTIMKASVIVPDLSHVRRRLQQMPERMSTFLSNNLIDADIRIVSPLKQEKASGCTVSTNGVYEPAENYLNILSRQFLSEIMHHIKQQLLRALTSNQRQPKSI